MSERGETLTMITVVAVYATFCVAALLWVGAVICLDRRSAPMANKVVVEWFTNKSNGGMQVGPRQEPRKFKSRTAAVRFVMEELEESRRHNVRMIVFSTLFECTPHASDYETFSSASSGRERNPIDSSSFPSAAYSN